MRSAKPLGLLANYSEARRRKVVRELDAADSKRGVAKALRVLRIGYWFEYLRHRTRMCTAYGVGKHLQPEAYRKRHHGCVGDEHAKNCDGDHRNLWAKYAQAIHAPSVETVLAVNHKVPGSADVWSTMAWEAFDVEKPIGSCGDELLKRSPPAVQNAVYDGNALDHGRYRRRRSLRTTLGMLECHANLEGVAAMTILLREAHQASDPERCYDIGCSIHAALLMATARNPVFGVRAELFEFFIRRVFPIASGKEIAFDVTASELSELTFQLQNMILRLEDQGRIDLVTAGSTRDVRKILRGQFGFDLQYALGPRLRLLNTAEESSEAARRVDAR